MKTKTNKDNVLHLSRKEYAKSIMGYFVFLVIVIVLCAIFLFHFIPILGAIIVGCTALVACAMFVHVSWLRANDILGKRTPISIAVVYVVLCIIPYLGFLFWFGSVIFFLSRPGAISNGVEPLSLRFVDDLKEKAKEAVGNTVEKYANSPIDKNMSSLDQLFSLKEKGAITEEEYQQEKSKILGK